MNLDAKICVSGTSELLTNLSGWLRRLASGSVFTPSYINNCHALITSMNLYAYSQQNNDEMGILVSAEDDADLCKAIEKEAQRILVVSQPIFVQI